VPKQLKLYLRIVGALVLFGILVAIMASPSPALRKHKDRREVRLWHMWSGEWKDVIEGIVAEYNASQTEFEVVPLSLPNGAQSKLQMGIAGGDPPDLMVEWNPILPTWAEAGLLQKLDELMTPEERARYDAQAYPIVKRVGGYRGHIYGLAVGLNLTACYVRTDFLKEVGLPEEWVPETLEELEEVGKRLDKFDGKGNLTRIGFNPPGFKAVAPAFHGGFYNWKENGKGGLLIDTKENLNALQHVVDQRKRLGFDNVVRFQSGQGSDMGGAWAFIQGAYGITIDGQWRVEQLRKYAPQVPYRVFPIPPPKGGLPLAQMTGGNFIVIPSGAKNIEGAWKFVKWWNGLADPNTAAMPFALMAQMPPSSGVAESPAYAKYLKENPMFAKFVEMLPSPNIHPLPPVAIQQFLNDKIASAEDSALRGSISPKASLEKAQREINEELERRRTLGYRE
jgi:multiple sugar transport system substrate-binding protein